MLREEVGVMRTGVRLLLMILLPSAFLANVEAWASCKDLPPGVPCLDFQAIRIAGATGEEAQRLIAKLQSLGPEAIAKSCFPMAKMRVTEFLGAICGDGRKLDRLCEYSGKVNCTVDEKLFEVVLAGQCPGDVNSCGTFRDCVKVGFGCERTSFEREGPSLFRPLGFISDPPQVQNPPANANPTQRKGVAQ